MQVQEVGGFEYWKWVKKKFCDELGDDVFISWFVCVDFEEYQDGIVCLLVLIWFLKQWIQNNYNDRFMGFWQCECDNVYCIEFIVCGVIWLCQVLLV